MIRRKLENFNEGCILSTIRPANCKDLVHNAPNGAKQKIQLFPAFCMKNYVYLSNRLILFKDVKGRQVVTF